MFAAFKHPVAFKNLSPLGCLEDYETSLKSVHLQTFDLYKECGAGMSLNSFSSTLQLFPRPAQVQGKIQLRKSGMCYLSGHRGESQLPVRHRHCGIPQNHRMVGVGRDLCGSPSPTPCRSRVTQSRLCRTTSRWVLNLSREGDSTTSLPRLSL